MSVFPSTARVVVIGGGVVGTSCLYHLAKLGWTNCVLLEKNELTSGSTWHAAGNIPTFSSSWSIMHMQRYSVELYQKLGEEVDYAMPFHTTGSVRLAHSSERMQEFEKVCGMGRYQGMNIEMCDVQNLKERYPFLETHDLEGGLYDPYDGDIDPAQLTQALAKGARSMGAHVERFCSVTGAKRKDGEWHLKTNKGKICCEFVVNAAGYRAQEVGALFGRYVPMVTLSHQYMVTDNIPELKAWNSETGLKLPLLRDVDSSYYLRQENDGLILGPYERDCKAHWTTPDDPMPEDFSFQLFPDDLERLSWYIEDAMGRVPLLGKVGIKKVINGPVPYAPDGNPLLGPMPGVPNAFEACVFTFGICQGGGAGKILAEWITQGTTEWDMWSCDPRRFTSFADQDYTNKKGMEIYGHEYAMHFPHHAWPAARKKRLSAVHGKIKSAGAQFGAYAGWERADWFAHPGDDTSEEATQTWKRKGPWYDRIREECHAVRDAAGILDLPGFSRFVVSGSGVVAWLRKLITGFLPKVGRLSLIYFSDSSGRLMTEMTVVRIAKDKLLLMTSAAAEWHDLEWLKRHLPEDGSIQIENQTEEWSCQVLTGPKSRAILSEVCDADLTKPWLTIQSTKVIGGQEASLFRVSYAGELGWEIHTHVPDTSAVFDSIMKTGKDHGLKPFGMFALDCLRIEKGYRVWKGDLSTDYTILQSGLERFVRWQKKEFIGKAAMELEREKGVTKQFVILTLDDHDYDAPYMSAIWSADKIVGEVTSAGWGHRIDQSIALAMIQTDCAQIGTQLEVEVFGERVAAIVTGDEPLYDPNNDKIRV